MPGSLAPDPISVQPCVCCLFWTNRNCMAVTSIFLSCSFIQLEINPYIGAITVNGNIYFYWNFSGNKCLCSWDVQSSGSKVDLKFYYPETTWSQPIMFSFYNFYFTIFQCIRAVQAYKFKNYKKFIFFKEKVSFCGSQYLTIIC